MVVVLQIVKVNSGVGVPDVINGKGIPWCW